MSLLPRTPLAEWSLDLRLCCRIFQVELLLRSGFRTYEYAIQFARECRKFDAAADLKDQLNRASASIALNLKEGSARHTRRDRHRFYRTALGSFRECEAIFDIIDLDNAALRELTNSLGGSLNCLCRSTRIA